MNVVFSPTAWKQYTEWQGVDKTIVKKINDLIQDIHRKSVDDPWLLKRYWKTRDIEDPQGLEQAYQPRTSVSLCWR